MGPDGFNVGSPKGPLLVEHGRELVRLSPNNLILASHSRLGKRIGDEEFLPVFFLAVAEFELQIR